MAPRRPARFTGISTYSDPKGRFTFRYPTDWHRFDLADDREGVMFAPEAEDPETRFSVWISSLDEHVVAEDLEDLRIGVNEGLSNLAECKVESESETILGNLIKFERIFTFRENAATRKRRLWILYVDKWLMVVTWQGASEEDYEHWLGMANYSFNTFNLPEALWFSTDRDLSGLLGNAAQVSKTSEA
jgi:photosystem II reaction center protein PsbP